MTFKRSPFAIQDKNERDLDNAEDFPTIADLMREQKVPQDEGNTVHHRRDLDILGQFKIIAGYKFYNYYLRFSIKKDIAYMPVELKKKFEDENIFL